MDAYPTVKLDDSTTMFRNDQTGSSYPIVTVKVAVDQGKGNGPALAIQRLTNPSVKDEVFKRASEFGLANHGISKAGGYRPVTEEKDGRKIPVAYELDFKFTRTI